MPHPYQAIAAMSENRVIGCRNAIPWHIPEDFRWFKRKTTGHILVMGRKTFESIGRPLPDRETIVLTRSGWSHPGVRTCRNLQELPASGERTVFICGGAEIYAQALKDCSDLFLTLVKRVVEGDAYFPPFEHLFRWQANLAEEEGFVIRHYTRRAELA